MSQLREPQLQRPICSLLLFLATSAEQRGLKRAAEAYHISCTKDPELTRYFQQAKLNDEAWRIGPFGPETVIAIGPSRKSGQAIMGAYGRLGSASKSVRYLEATGAQGMIQLGIAFGTKPNDQQIGDVLVSAMLLPYDNRDVKPSLGPLPYKNDYASMPIEFPRASLLERCIREKKRSSFDFNVHIGAILSGSARIHCAAYRDELYRTVPHGNDDIVGGEMEGVGLLAASMKSDEPAWCVIKGISDFADENRDSDIQQGREIAAYNAARFLLSSLRNDVEMLNYGANL